MGGFCDVRLWLAGELGPVFIGLDFSFIFGIMRHARLKGGKMEAKWVLRELMALEFEPEAVSHFCYFVSLRKQPWLELTTDGFMLCYERFSGVYLYRKGNDVMCRFMRHEYSVDLLTADQARVRSLFKLVISHLLAA